MATSLFNSALDTGRSLMSSTTEQFRASTIGDTFFKNASRIFVFVILLFGALLYLDSTREIDSTAASSKRLRIEGFKGEECKDDFCVFNNKNPKYLNDKCAEIKDKNKCSSLCCCGWVKYAGMPGEGECVAGDAENPSNYRNIDGTERDVDMYYYMRKCVRGKNCP